MNNSISPTPMHETSSQVQKTALCKVSMALAVVAVTVHSVGMTCPYWLVGAIIVPQYGLNRINAGIFQGCSDLTGCVSKSNANQWQTAAAVLEVIAEVTCIAYVIVLFTALFTVKTERTLRYVKISSSLTALVDAIFMTTALALYGVNANDLLPGVMLGVSWAYVLVAVSAILNVITFVLLIIDLII